MFCNQDSQTTNDYLVAKGWIFDGVGKAHPTLQAAGHWKFKKPGNYPDGVAASILVSDKRNGKRQALYFTVVKPYHDALKKQIIAACTKISSSSDDNCLNSQYSAATFGCRIGVCKWSDSPFIAYTVTISR